MIMNPKINTKVRIAWTQKEIEAHFDIRRKVFVQEQGIFKQSDRDEFDKKAIPIICEIDGKIVGTVRIFPLTSSTWMGGRLAVLKEFRTYMVGPLLVNEAVKTVKRKGGTKFLAHIQPQNVRFFQRLGWKLTGEEVEINGIIHQVMEADLNRF